MASWQFVWISALVAVTACSPFAPGTHAPTYDQVPVHTFPASNIWRQVIGAQPALDPSSALFVATLVREREPNTPFGLAKEGGVSVFYTDSNTARFFVPIESLGDARKGVKSVPIPEWVLPDGGTDAHTALIDPVHSLSFEFWQFRNRHGRWVCGNAAVLDLNGSSLGPSITARASGFSLLGGVIWPQEILGTNIPHALMLVVRKTRKGNAYFPATYSDGWSDEADAIPMGAQVQLDPELDLDTLGLDVYQKAVFRALQLYGAYVGDTGGLAVKFVCPRSYASDPYVGIPSYYEPYGTFKIDMLPLNRLRILKLGREVPRTNLMAHPEWFE
jgi:hypothetical protein